MHLNCKNIYTAFYSKNTYRRFTCKNTYRLFTCKNTYRRFRRKNTYRFLRVKILWNAGFQALQLQSRFNVENRQITYFLKIFDKPKFLSELQICISFTKKICDEYLKNWGVCRVLTSTGEICWGPRRSLAFIIPLN